MTEGVALQRGGADAVSSREVRAGEIDTGDRRARELGTFQIGVLEVRPVEDRPLQVRSFEIRSGPERGLEVGAAQDCVLRLRLLEVGALERVRVKVRTLDVRAPEVPSAEVASRQVEPAQVHIPTVRGREGVPATRQRIPSASGAVGRRERRRAAGNTSVRVAVAEVEAGGRPPGRKVYADDDACSSLPEDVLGAESELEDADDVPVIVDELCARPTVRRAWRSALLRLRPRSPSSARLP